ncbi:MerR family transcriptional regulator [Aneurinibacillus sp. Ricciae_BoGa-3]|uniref:MerR family transcriptional regulator n=1 Tax=Aneurinibacillus sp. Ricciae_BoGa-3 TaxID=3022697 RepID=UPI0023414139|nr:MerR family transcriptional regulator [Aneurinibacillus sp. Ricciae_BoGa-3]WCK54831.1 MerR family transcriptional regulator [Aneurinibacillus sp. Ricciae_BoGa-3]
MSYSMKYVVDHLNISANTLRFYETEGILNEISRDSKGRRIYSEENIEWIKFIRCLRETGMPISKIKEYIDLYELGNATFLQRKEMMMQHKLEVQNKINESLKYLEIISYKVATYELQEEEVMKNNIKCHL